MDPTPVSLGLAFAAGLVSFLSPCVLPIVPGYLAFVTGMSLDELSEGTETAARRRGVVYASLFVAGFTLVFVALGASTSALGGLVHDWLPVLQRVGGVVIVAFGLLLLGVLRVPALLREWRVHGSGRLTGPTGAVVAGVAFGAGWTPCIGPVLGSILLYAGFGGSVGHGMLLLFVYAVGLGVPFILAALLFNRFMTASRSVRRWLLPIERVAGAALVAVGVLLVTGQFTLLANYFASFGQLINLPI
jgi:cytochrome c-type biogenesis protein